MTSRMFSFSRIVQCRQVTVDDLFLNTLCWPCVHFGLGLHQRMGVPNYTVQLRMNDDRVTTYL